MGTVSKNRGMSCVGVRKTGTTLIRVSTVMGTLYGDNTDVRMVWVLQGRVDGEKSFEYYHNSPNAKIAHNAKSYGIVSINSKLNNRQRLWQEIINNVFR